MTLAIDLALYVLSAVFAGITAATSTLLPHRAWGAIAVVGYSAAALVAGVHLLAKPSSRPTTGRAVLVALTWVTTALLPLAVEAVQRASGRTDRAQEEVIVIEEGGRRLLDTGTPYLGRDAIAALPESERLLGYLPYQPGMSVFGIPRALLDTWWTDARVWFALATIAALGAALEVLRRAGIAPTRLIRAMQVATVLPICALTLATGGDDLPVLALCLLAVAFATAVKHATFEQRPLGRGTPSAPETPQPAADKHATFKQRPLGRGTPSAPETPRAGVGRAGASGLAVGAAASLKLFAWPIALVFAVYFAVTQGRRALGRYALGAAGLPILTLVPVLVKDHAGVVENIVRFPLGRGLVTSPAQSPLPGHLIAEGLPGGRAIALGLLLLTGVAIAVALWRRPPRTAASATFISGYGLLAAMLLLPSTRFGYLLYPAALLVWGWALAGQRSDAR